MRRFSADDIHALAPYGALVDALNAAFQTALVAPERHHHTIKSAGAEDATLLLMPAWKENTFIGVKAATIHPGNAAIGKPAVHALYFWLDARDGTPLALFDGAALTARRTAAASALAARYLARDDASVHLMVGAGALAPHLMRAHASQRRLGTFLVWARRHDQAEKIAAAARSDGLNAQAAGDLEAAAREADIISCATLSEEPLIFGAWLKPGAHLDLVGAFKPTMRETDDVAVKRATLFCDSKSAALKEGGDILIPLRAGVIAEGDIAGDLGDLATGAHPGRRGPDEITLYKSVGAALQDYAAADLIWRRTSQAPV